MQSCRYAYQLRRLIKTTFPVKPMRMLSVKTQYYNSDGYYCDTAMATASDPYDLASGVPPPDILEASSKYIVQATLSLHKHSPPSQFLGYGPNLGPVSCLDGLSYFLSRRYRTSVAAEKLCIVAGASHGLHLVTSVVGPLNGCRVYIEEPSYMHAIDIFNRDFNYEIVPVKTDDQGVIPSDFEVMLEKYPPNGAKDANRYSGIMYFQTAFANPGCWSMPKKRLAEMEKMAKKHNVLIIVDDVYSFTSFADLNDDESEECDHSFPYLPSAATVDNSLSENIVTLGSISKLAGPGLRFAWVVAPNMVLKALDHSGVITSSGCTNQYTASLVGEMIADGSADVLTDMTRKELKKRLATAERIFKAHLPGNVKYHVPQGGYFAWIELPSLPTYGNDKNSTSLVDHLLQRFAVRVQDGSACYAPHRREKYESTTLRVSLTVLPNRELSVALRNLSEGICDYLGFKPTV